MKKINLIERLLSYSHEKQSPQRFGRYAAMLIMLLTLGVGQMWANTKTDIGGDKFYFNNSNIKANDGNKVGSWQVSGGYTYFNFWGGDSSEGYTSKQTASNVTGDVYKINFPSGNHASVQLVRGPSGSHWNHTYEIDAANFANGKNYYWCDKDGNYCYSYYVEDAYVYFDNSSVNWGTGSNYIYFNMGRYNYTSGGDNWKMANIPNTKIYYKRVQNFADYDRYRFCNTTTYNEHNSAMSETPGVSGYTAIVQNSSNVLLKYNSHNLFTYSGSNGSSVTKNEVSAYDDLNITITIKEKYNASGSTPWNEVSTGTMHGTISVSGNKFGSWTTCAASSSASITKETSTYSASAKFGRTSTITLSAGATKDGKAFVGWYKSNGSLISADTETTYEIGSSNETVYAYYKDEETHNVTVSYKCGPYTIKAQETESAVGISTTRSVTAPSIAGYHFVSWTLGTDVTSTNGTSTNPITINSVHNGSDFTLTANYGVSSGWYLIGTDFGNTWNTSCITHQITSSYRGRTDVVYYPVASLSTNYWKLHNGSNMYNTKAGDQTIDKNTVYSLVQRDESGSTKISSAQSNVWIVLDKRNSTKKLWVQSEQTYYNVNVTGADDSKGAVSVTLSGSGTFYDNISGLATTQFANGETFKVTVSKVSGWVPTITIGGTEHPFWKEADSYSATGTMSTSDVAVTISYTPTRALTFAMTTGCNAVTATGPSATNVTSGTKIKDGTSITFTQTNSTGYTFSKWYSNSSGTSGTQYATTSSYSLTVSSTAYTIYPIYTENYHSTTVQVSPAGYGTTSPAAGAQNIKQVTGNSISASPSNANYYRFKNWSVSGGGLAMTYSNTTNPNTFKATAASGTITANFAPRWSIIGGDTPSAGSADAMGDWSETANQIINLAKNASNKDTGYVNITLPANSLFYFKPKDVQGNTGYGNTGNMTYAANNKQDWVMSSGESTNCRITTAGAGTYKFRWNITDKKLMVTYPVSYTVTYGLGTGGSTISATVQGDAAALTASGKYAAEGKDITFTQTAATGYTFDGWYTAASGGSAIACMASDNVYESIAGNINVYAQYTADHYSDTDNLLNTDESTAGGYNVDYDATSIVFTTGYEPSKTGYEIEGFYTNAACTVKVANANRSLTLSTTDYSSGGKWKYEGAPNLYINWRAKTYTVKLDKNGTSSGYLTDGSATATYDYDYLRDITLPTRTGYHVPSGSTGAFYRETELSIPIATKVGELNDNVYGYTDGVGNWTRDDGATLYTKWEANRYTVRYNDNHENYIGYASGSTTAQYPHYDDPAFTLQRNGFRLAGYSFLGWATTPTGEKVYNDEAEVSNLTSEENGTFNLYALWDPQPVTVSFYVGSGSCATTSTSVVMGENYGTGTGLSGSLPTPTPAEGYVFTGWKDLSGNSITSSTQLTNGNDHTLYAQYSQISYVYFYNNLGWSHVYVTYDAYWNNTKGTGNQDRIYHEMTLVDGTTNIYRDEIPASVLGSWKGWIAFNNEQLGTIGDDGGYDDFNSGQVVFRHDFDSYATMFVPDPTQSFKKEWSGNYAWYYSSTWEEDKTGDVVTNYRHTRGYWTQYNTTNSGFVMKGNWDSWNKDNYFLNSNSGEMTYTTTKPLEANTTYQFLLYKHCTTSNTHSSTFTNTSASAITSAACTDLVFRTENTATGSTRNSQITTTVAGDYKFTLTCGTDGVLKLSVRYPVAAGDYRVVYEWNDGEDDHAHISEIIQAEPSTEKKMTFFVHKAAKVSSQALKIQKCTSVVGSTATWTDDKDNSGAADAPIDLSDVTENGLYNFIITQPASGEPTGAYAEPYDGPVYLRSDANSGSWNSYTGYLNRMTYSPYSLTQTLSAPYSHYYCTYIDDAVTNVAFTVATDYSPSICDTLVGDNIIGTTPDGPVYKHLPSGHPANIRFTWNQEDNSITRSYLKSAQGDGNKRYLVLHGKDSHILNSSGGTIAGEGEGADQLHANELLFVDQKDWIYQVNLKATPIAKVSLIAKYNNADRYLVGGPSTYETILGAEADGETAYPLTAIYDFKTNRLMVAWTPDETAINDNLKDIDMLWVRHASNLGPQAATQINIGTGSLKNVAIVGAIEFQYNEIVGNVYSWTQSTRNLLKHFVSFPFDVKVADIFGLNGSELGREYVIQKYNGAKRAQKGLFGGDGSYFWEYLTADSIMHAGEGYIVMMDNDYIGDRYHDMWENKSGSDKIYLYFPASKPMNIVDKDSVVVVPRHTCNIDRTFKVDGKELNHKNTDSHWNIIGSPFFHNSYIKTSGSGATEADTAMSAYYYLDYSYNEWRTAAVTRSTVFKAMSSVMVQWQGPATWTIAAPPASVAARKSNEPETNLLKLELLNNDQTADWVFVEMKEGANADFVLCEDLYKITSSRTPSIYAFAGDYDVSYSQVPVENQIIPLGVILLQNGTYTFSMPSNFNGTVTLIDTFAQTRTNLALEDYVVNLQKGTINDRFFLELNVNNAPTAIDGVTDGSGTLKDGKAHKFIMNDMMYILRDGVIYDATGRRVE